MNESDKEFLKEFLRGVAGASMFFIVFIVFCLIIISMSGTKTVTDEEQSTKVVGTYKDCDIIQWHYGALAEYKYFLHCPK